MCGFVDLFVCVCMYVCVCMRVCVCVRASRQTHFGDYFPPGTSHSRMTAARPLSSKAASLSP